MDADGILARYDRAMRRDPAPLPPSFRLVRDGMLTAIVGPDPSAHDNCLIYATPDPAGVEPTIAAAMACFEGHGFEWKLYGHDDAAGEQPAPASKPGFVAGAPRQLDSPALRPAAPPPLPTLPVAL